MSTQKWKGVVCTTIVSLTMIVGTSLASVTNDRDYKFGDESSEQAQATQLLGSGTNSGRTYDSEYDDTTNYFDAQDLKVIGAPTYETVTGRGAANGTLTAQFNGTSDVVLGVGFDESISWAFNRPDWYWDQPPFFNGESQTQYPRNYEGITSRGLQTWIKPNSNQQNVRQDVVLDSSEFGGVVITANNKWGMAYDMDDTNRELGNDGIFEAAGTQAGVAFDQWTHLEVRTLTGASNAVMYVNGEAVAIGRGAGLVFGYDAASKVDPGDSNSTLKDSPEPLFVGASDLDGDGSYENHFQGQVDELTMYLWGDNSGQPDGPLGQMGQDWGTYDFFTDNAFVAGLNLLMGDFDQNGVLDSADTAVIVNNWRSANLMEGFAVGDLNTYRTMGDMNVDGVTDWIDWAAYRDAYIAENGVAPSFADVPEPATMLLLGAGGLVLARRRKRGGSTKSQWRGKKMTQRFSSIAIIAIVMLFGFGAANVSAQTLWNVDIGGDAHESGGNVGQDTVAHPHGPDAFGQWQQILVPPVVSEESGLIDNLLVDPAFNGLTDSTGTATGLNIVFTGKLGGWTGRPGTGTLEQDFIILNAAGLYPVSIDFMLTGLTPSTQYTIQLQAGRDGGGFRAFDSLLDLNGDGLLTDETATTVTNQSIFTFTTDATGQTIGQWAAPNAEGNVAAFQLIEGTNMPDDRMKVVINRETGNVTLLNNLLGSAPDVELVGYSLLSNTGGLKSGSWTSITDHYDQTPQDGSVDADDDWMIVAQNNGELGEGTLGLAEVASGQTIDMGNAWLQSIFEDVAFEYLTADGTLVQGIVEFTGNDGNSFAIGDLNFDGVIDSDDWGQWRPNFKADLAGISVAEGYSMGDLNGDGLIDVADYGLFKSAYDAANGDGSFAVMLASIPEPGTMMLLGLGSLAALRRRRGIAGDVRKVNGNRKMKAMKHVVLMVLLLGVVSAGQTHAAVGIIGEDGTTLSNWRTAAALESDIQYGTDGYVLYGIDSPDGTWTQVYDATTVLGGDAAADSQVVLPSYITDIALADGTGRWSGNGNFGQIEDPAAGNALTNTAVLAWGDVPYLFTLTRATDQAFRLTILLTDGDGNDLVWNTSVDAGAVGNAAIAGATANGANNQTYHVYDIASGTDDITISVESVGTGMTAITGFAFDSALAPQILTLKVNTFNGASSIANDAAAAIDFDFYEITSEAGLLDPSGWNSLQDQNATGFPSGDGSGDGWEELGNSAATTLAEAYLQGQSVVADGAEQSLGKLADITGTEADPQGDGDLAFTYRLPNGFVQAGLVEYFYDDSVQIILGDVNGDGLVNGFDVDPFVDVLLNGPYQAEADVNEDGAVNGFDVDPFVALVLGGGSGPAGTEVPEPMTLVLLGLGGLAVMRRR